MLPLMYHSLPHAHVQGGEVIGFACLSVCLSAQNSPDLEIQATQYDESSYHYSVGNVGKCIFFSVQVLEKGHEHYKLCVFLLDTFNHTQLIHVLFQLRMLEFNKGKGRHIHMHNYLQSNEGSGSTYMYMCMMQLLQRQYRACAWGMCSKRALVLSESVEMSLMRVRRRQTTWRRKMTGGRG